MLQLAVAVVNLSIVALAFTSIWPFPSGQFNVDLPTSSEITWTYEDGVVHVRAPYSIDNGGFYDVKDLVLKYTVTNDTGFLLAGQDIVIGDIPAGQVTSSAIDFQFDLLRLFNSGAYWMVLNDDLLRFYIGVSCLYTAELVKFDAEYQVYADWVAPIKDYGAELVNWGNTSTIVGDIPDSVNITYWLETSDLLAPFSPASIDITLRADSTPLSNWSTTAELGLRHEDDISLTLNPADFLSLDSETRFYLVVHVSVAGFVQDRIIEIESPLSGGLP